MSRKGSLSAETGSIQAECDNCVLVGTAAFDTGQARTGARSFKCAGGGGGGYVNFQNILDSTGGRDYYKHVAFRLASGTLTGEAHILWVWSQTGSEQVMVFIDTAGLLKVRWNDVSPTVVSSGLTPTRDAWHVIELRTRFNAASNDEFELKIDGVTAIATQSRALTTGSIGDLFFGEANGTSNLDMWFDDLLVNDNQGANDATWPGDHRLDVLWPTSENAVAATFLKPGGGNTLRYSSIDNVPPVGVAHSTSAANAEKQIYNIASTITDNADFNMESFTTAGLGASDVVNHVQLLAMTGVNSVTTRAGALRTVSNPAQGAEDSIANVGSGAAAGAYPTNWKRIAGAMQYAPTVVNGTSPVCRFGKRAASTDSEMVTMLGLFVDYSPSTATPPPPVISNAAAQRAASW